MLRILLWPVDGLTYLIILAHELCHYGAARSFGIPAHMGPAEVSFPTSVPDWQHVIVALAPAVAGILPTTAILFYAFGFAESGWERFWAFELIVLALAWYAGCAYDIWDVLHFGWYGEWPAERIRPRQKD